MHRPGGADEVRDDFGEDETDCDDELDDVCDLLRDGRCDGDVDDPPWVGDVRLPDEPAAVGVDESEVSTRAVRIASSSTTMTAAANANRRRQ